MAALEAAGLPTVAILSSGFVAQGLFQAEALGLLEPEKLMVLAQHPISDATAAEMHAKADAVFPSVLRSLVSNMPAPKLTVSKLSAECAAGA